ncbi:MAG: hypothetical protein R3C19_23570 [Planctomycetaceae bacterium]
MDSESRFSMIAYRTHWHRTLPILLCGFIAGCGDSPSTTEPGGMNAVMAVGDDIPVEKSQPEAAITTENSDGHRRDEVWTDENGNKYLGKIPFDVFAVHPYEIAADTTPVNGAATATIPVVANSGNVPQTDVPDATSQNPGTSPTPATTANSGSAGDGWDSVISRDVLEAEIKDIRNFLTPTLQSVGNFRSSMAMIPPKAATLGVLAEVAREHPDKVTWVEDAAYLSDLARQMNLTPLQAGPKDQKRLRDLFAAITDTLNRSRPANLEKPPEGQMYSDIAEMRLVMKRMEEASRRMRTEVGNESSLAANKDMVRHEAEILRTLTKVVTTSGYGYSDDTDFNGYARQIIDASAKIISAADSNNFSDFQLSQTEVANSCQACHHDYKSN